MHSQNLLGDGDRQLKREAVSPACVQHSSFPSVRSLILLAALGDRIAASLTSEDVEVEDVEDVGSMMPPPSFWRP